MRFQFDITQNLRIIQFGLEQSLLSVFSFDNLYLAYVKLIYIVFFHLIIFYFPSELLNDFRIDGFDGLDWIARILEYNISIISNSSPKPVFFSDMKDFLFNIFVRDDRPSPLACNTVLSLIPSPYLAEGAPRLTAGFRTE